MDSLLTEHEHRCDTEAEAARAELIRQADDEGDCGPRMKPMPAEGKRD
ncbi:hypothetical protein [Henriciella sp.]|nr:hypothetical protein [Henriciella sp.]